MNKNEISGILEIAKDKNGEVPMRLVRQAFDKLQERQKGEWIPCSETVDLPEDEVLCCDRYKNELIGWLSCEDDQWLCESDGEMMYDPIAWMPCPEPYAERRES